MKSTLEEGKLLLIEKEMEKQKKLRREKIAVTAMQVILANKKYEPPRRNKFKGTSEDAVAMADAPLGELGE